MTTNDPIARLTSGQRWALAERLFARAPGTFETWSEPQRDAYNLWVENELNRILLFYPTGKGKTKTALGLLYAAGHREVVVITPPKTKPDWDTDARLLGMNARIESVEKFRRQATQYRKDIPIVVDEFQLMGGHDAMGWKKLNRMATKLTAPLIIMSATPYYNDAERVFCIDAVCGSNPNRNYKSWLYKTCETVENHFSPIPDVVGFLEYDSATDYLLDKPYTAYIEDDAVWRDEALPLPSLDLDVFERLGYSHRHHRIMNSLMEKFHKEANLRFIDDEGLIRESIYEAMLRCFEKYPDRNKWLIFCNHKDVARALYNSADPGTAWLIDGDTVNHDEVKHEFIRADRGWLIGTTALATGVDGIDKVCQSMLILDDVRGDGSKRRQLIGRILPRGTDDGIERLVVTATIE